MILRHIRWTTLNYFDKRLKHKPFSEFNFETLLYLNCDACLQRGACESWRGGHRDMWHRYCMKWKGQVPIFQCVDLYKSLLTLLFNSPARLTTKGCELVEKGKRDGLAFSKWSKCVCACVRLVEVSLSQSGHYSRQEEQLRRTEFDTAGLTV